MDKATPTPSPATVNGVMELVREYASLTYSSGMAQARGQASGTSLWPEQYNALRAEVERLAAQAAPTDNSNGETRLWLWKNFVDGRPEYWAFDNPYPINLDNGDPQTLGEPCGYAIFKPSRSGGADFSEDAVLLRIAQAKSKASYNLEPNNAEADAFDFLRFAKKNLDMHAARVPFAYNGLVTAAVAWIQSAEKILAAQSPAQAPVQPQAVVPAAQRPVNCGTGHCSCIECVVDADRASSGATTPAAPFAKDSWQHAVDNQLVAFGRTSQEFANPHEALAWLAIMNMELGQSNAGATTQAVRMLTEYEQAAIIDMHSTGRAQGDHECAEAIQRKFCEVNNLRIPASGEIGSV